jgi:hypothetical protein
MAPSFKREQHFRFLPSCFWFFHLDIAGIPFSPLSRFDR